MEELDEYTSYRTTAKRVPYQVGDFAKRDEKEDDVDVDADEQHETPGEQRLTVWTE
jgi:hypothetical protein